MDGERELQDKVREAVRGGVLPLRKPDHTWGGPGNGAPCVICVKPLSPNDMVFDVEFATDSGPVNYQLHARCFRIWEVERDRETNAVATSEASGTRCTNRAAGNSPTLDHSDLHHWPAGATIDPHDHASTHTGFRK